MTKVEIIRELTKCDPRDIRSLCVVYYNKSTNTKYFFDYDYKSAATSLELKRELSRVLLSMYKLRRYIDSISASFFPLPVGSSPLDLFYSSCNDYVFGISDFIKTIKNKQL